MLKETPPQGAPAAAEQPEYPTVRPALSGGSYSQTLSRGVQVLEVLAAAQRPQSAGELADLLGMHRSVIYRLIRTLEGHRLLATEPDGRYTLGLGLLTLARGVQLDLRRMVRPVLTELSAAVGATAIVDLVEGDEIVCVASVEPSDGLVRVIYREGYRHPVNLGAGGLAILSAQPPEEGEREAITQAREQGYAVSSGELETGSMAISSPVIPPRGPARLSVTVLLPTSFEIDIPAVGEQVRRAAMQVATLF